MEAHVEGVDEQDLGLRGFVLVLDRPRYAIGHVIWS